MRPIRRTQARRTLPFINILSYLPPPGVKQVHARRAYIVRYGQLSMAGLRYAQESGTLTPPIFFGKTMNLKNVENSLTDYKMREEAVEFMVAGTDTTSNTLTYHVWVVCRDERVRGRLEEEVSTLLENYTDKELERLAYLSCVVKEALRLYGTASGSHAGMCRRADGRLAGIICPTVQS